MLPRTLHIVAYRVLETRVEVLFVQYDTRECPNEF
jgi:plasmid stabilization system protein ParE